MQTCRSKSQLYPQPTAHRAAYHHPYAHSASSYPLDVNISAPELCAQSFQSVALLHAKRCARSVLVINISRFYDGLYRGETCNFSSSLSLFLLSRTQNIEEKFCSRGFDLRIFCTCTFSMRFLCLCCCS